MATAVSRRCLGGGLSFLVVALFLSFAVLSAAGEESSYTPGADSGAPLESEVVEDTVADGLAQILKESQALDDAYKTTAKKAKKADLMQKGLTAATGASLLGLLAQTGLMIKSRNPVSKKRGGVAIATALMGLAALGGAMVVMMKKKKLQKAAGMQAANLLKHREEMLEKIQENETENTDALVDRAEEIANLADNLGLFYPKNAAAQE